MKKLLLVGVVGLSALVGGCASVVPMHGPNGKPALAVECSGKFSNWNYCYKKLSEECGSKGYQLVTRDNEQHMSGGSYASASGGLMGFSGSGGSAYGTSNTRTLMAQCNE